MKNHHLISALAGLVLAFSPVQPWSLDSIATAAADPAPTGHKLFLWRVSGGRGTAYVLGSIHVGKADLYPLPRGIEQLFESSDFLVEEIDVSKADPAADRQLILARARYPDGDRLENHVSDKTSLALSIYLQLTGRQPGAVSSFKPWFVAWLIRNEALRLYGFSGMKGIDTHFAVEAAALRKPVIQLETPSLQANLISSLNSSLSDAQQDELLLSSILQAQNAARYLQAAFAAWRNGDAAAMERLTPHRDRDPQSQLFQDEVYYKRNAEMARQLDYYMNTPHKYFVVVGAAHLIGDHGILKLLQDKGFQIDQLVVKERDHQS